MTADLAFTAPVSRTLATADLDRARRFYGGLLGLTVRDLDGAIEATLGPVRLLVRPGADAPDSTGRPAPRGTAQVFLEVRNVEAWRERIVGGGGDPGPIARVNWIKYRMFDVVDPDGHRLWLAESFRESVPDAPEPMCRLLLPVLPVDLVSAAAEHYRTVLGFGVNHLQEDIAVMERDRITLLLVPRRKEIPGPAECYCYVRDADTLAAELRQAGAQVESDPVSRPWGLREFSVVDPGGNRITFGQPFE